MSPLLVLVPILMIFEIAQLVISERYLGIRHIGNETDPRTLGLGELTAFIWISGILLSWAWMVLMLFERMGRFQAVIMILITVIGFGIRRNCAHKWVLVVLTIEGALRVGMLLSIIGLYFRQR